jgi:hypothetical protein
MERIQVRIAQENTLRPPVASVHRLLQKRNRSIHVSEQGGQAAPPEQDVAESVRVTVCLVLEEFERIGVALL